MRLITIIALLLLMGTRIAKSGHIFMAETPKLKTTIIK